jgi:hypothetical protein
MEISKLFNLQLSRFFVSEFCEKIRKVSGNLQKRVLENSENSENLLVIIEVKKS